MKRDLSLTAPTPVLAAALRRRPGVRRRKGAERAKGGGGYVFFENNFVSIAGVSPGPNSGNASGAGARPGNRNALRTGEHTASTRAYDAHLRRLLERFDEALDHVTAAHQAGIDPRAALRRMHRLVWEASKS